MRHFFENEKEQNRIGRVQQQAGGVMPARVQAEELAIEHVREPGERMPVGGPRGHKRPPDVLRRQSAPHMRIFRDVILVVLGDEIVFERGREGQPDQRQQQKTGEKRLPPFRELKRLRFFFAGRHIFGPPKPPGLRAFEPNGGQGTRKPFATPPAAIFLFTKPRNLLSFAP